jgi:hypothetical protein
MSPLGVRRGERRFLRDVPRARLSAVVGLGWCAGVARMPIRKGSVSADRRRSIEGPALSDAVGNLKVRAFAPAVSQGRTPRHAAKPLWRRAGREPRASALSGHVRLPAEVARVERTNYAGDVRRVKMGVGKVSRYRSMFSPSCLRRGPVLPINGRTLPPHMRRGPGLPGIGRTLPRTHEERAERVKAAHANLKSLCVRDVNSGRTSLREWREVLLRRW